MLGSAITDVVAVNYHFLVHSQYQINNQLESRLYVMQLAATFKGCYRDG